MANMREIRTRIDSVKDTMKITNAMYLIASSKLRKARSGREAVSPYFEILQETISDILTALRIWRGHCSTIPRLCRRKKRMSDAVSSSSPPIRGLQARTITTCSSWLMNISKKAGTIPCA